MTSVLAANQAGPEAAAWKTAPSTRRWLHVLSHTDLKYGGLSSAVPALAASLQAQGTGMAMSVAAFCRDGEAVCPAVLVRDQVSFWPTSRLAWLKGRHHRRTFADMVREADALHIHGLWEQSTTVACRLARKLRKPYVLSAHGMLEPWALNAGRWKKQIYAALLERENVAGAACLQALTSAEAEQYRRFGARGAIAIVPNAIELPTLSGTQSFFEMFPQLRGKRLVLFLSRLHPKKGVDLLVQAWSRVQAQHPEAHLVLAGPDTDRMQMELLELLPGDQARASVTFTGMLSGAPKWSAFSAAEMFVLPSHSEGLSMALLEAMGAGLPVIATRACHMSEITAEKAGWEIEPALEDLVFALQQALASTPVQNQQRGAKGAQWVASRYSMGEITRQMGEVYRFVLEGRRPEGVAWREEQP